MAEIKETKEQLLEKLKHHTPMGSSEHEQIKTEIHVLALEELEASIDKLRESMIQISTSNDKLSRKILCLNIILTAATVFYAGVTFFQYINKTPHCP